MSMKTQDDKKNWYCIKFDVPKDKSVTALEFAQKMNLFLEQINEFNHSIVNGIDETYTVASYIEDFESGSVKWWLWDKLNKIDDTAIDKFVDNPIKTTISGILKFSKRKAIECLGGNNFNKLSAEEQKIQIIKPIIEQIELKKNELNRHALSPEIIIDDVRLFKSLAKMSEISKDLHENISYIDDYNDQSKQVIIANDFSYRAISKISIDDAVDDSVLQNTNEIIDIYTLLTPTSKDDCKWEFGENDTKIKCKMEDKAFFNRYILNQIKLGGNEKLKLKMRIETFLEQRTNKIKKEYTVLQVIDIFEDKNLFNYNQ